MRPGATTLRSRMIAQLADPEANRTLSDPISGQFVRTSEEGMNGSFLPNNNGELDPLPRILRSNRGSSTMSQHFGRPSTSPLIAPAECSLVLLAPSRRDLTTMSRQLRTSIRRNFDRIISAANVAGVTPFVCSPCNQPATHGFASHLAKFAHREFVAESSGASWQNVAFRNALLEHDRPALVIGGVWLEHQVVATALHALADSYDVYFVLDASPAKMQAAVRLSQDRLIQAGATPVVVSQVIHEWSLEATDAAVATALNALLLPDSASDIA